MLHTLGKMKAPDWSCEKLDNLKIVDTTLTVSLANLSVSSSQGNR